MTKMARVSENYKAVWVTFSEAKFSKVRINISAKNVMDLVKEL